MMGTLGGVATSCAALLLFVGTLRDRPGVSLFVAFGLALLFTMGARRILDRNAARQPWVTRSGELRKRGRIDARTRRGRRRRADSWRAGLGVSTREECRHFWPVHSSWRVGFATEQPSRVFAPVDAAVETQDTALQIAWISSKLLVCSCRRPVTKSVYDIEIRFSSVTSVRFALRRRAAERVRTPGLRLRRQNRRAPPQDMH
jgi:hypothetical protein